MKHEIPFIQFCLPNGRQKPTSTMVGDAEYEAYQVLASMGFRLTAEVLANGIVSQCIEDPAVGDFDMALSPNNEQVPLVLSRMLLRFKPEQAEVWRKQMTDPEPEDEEDNPDR